MAEPRITDQAQADLADVWEYLSPKSEKAADRLLSTILDKSRLHAQFPLMGRPRDDLLPGLRSFVVLPYVVFIGQWKIPLRCCESCMANATSTR
jgi:toxin ParE1/3/4